MEKDGKKHKSDAISLKEWNSKFFFRGKEYLQKLGRIQLGKNKNKFSEKDKILYFYLLFTHCSAGVALVDALYSVDQEMKGRYNLREICVDLQKGIPIHKSMSRIAGKDSFVSMTLKMGEQTGEVVESFGILHRYYQRRLTAKQEISKLLFYPGLVLINLVFVATLLITVILPGIRELYETAGVQIPSFAAQILWMTDFLKEYGKWVYLWIAVGLVSLDFLKSFEKIKSEFLWKIPGVRVVMQKLFMKRFSWMFSSLLNAGVDELSALETIQQMEEKEFIAQSLKNILEEARIGKRLSTSLSAHPLLFDHLYVLYLMQGEKSQAIKAHAQTLSELNEENAQKFMDNLVKYAQPLLVLFLGIMIGFILLMLLPLLDVTSLYAN